MPNIMLAQSTNAYHIRTSEEDGVWNIGYEVCPLCHSTADNSGCGRSKHELEEPLGEQRGGQVSQGEVIGTNKQVSRLTKRKGEPKQEISNTSDDWKKEKYSQNNKLCLSFGWFSWFV